MPTVTFLGHAGVAVDAVAFHLLADPWLAPTGAFLGAWHQYPRNDHLDTAALLEADWVAVSHEHLDHFDPWVIERLPARTRILIPRYPGPAFRERMAAAAGGRQVIELPAWEKFPLDNRGSWITAIPELSPMCHDAAFLMVADGHGFLNCNDARLTAAQARRAKHLVGGRLDLMALQTAGASWHPICYEYPAEEMAAVSMDKRVAKLRAVQRLVRQTAPELAVPFAGPPCFLDEEVSHLNRVLDQEDGAFCDPEMATAWLREHLPAQRWDHFRPGDSIDLGTGTVVRDPVSAAFSFADAGRAEYLRRYAEDRAPFIADVMAENPDPAPGLFDRFAAHFEHLGTLSDYFLRQIAMVVRFEITGPHGGSWDVDFSPDGLTVAHALPGTRPHYRITTAGRWLEGVLDGRMAWEDLLISFRVGLYRDPDVYNDHLVGLLKHANAPALQAVEAYETGRDETERIVVEWRGGSYDIPRYCPHAGEDLSIGAVIRDGRVHCLAHNFAFDLATGACVNARAANLTSRRVS
ncbi:MBL fold metallo-hydrolase [Actinomadura graeca]|uniref:MBL fold metallo-hydrolase n=1 Tax=Actinomadura graeca TaxID=2750812 RepID=A0ABX8QT46_9ACTN|nr:Rieske 2Fe-2S domain-containing protein [Actinomadura graeca]QXJ21900.1 MBL fold metallo-hydrolase [Actinomadura graeca]